RVRAMSNFHSLKEEINAIALSVKKRAGSVPQQEARYNLKELQHKQEGVKRMVFPADETSSPTQEQITLPEISVEDLPAKLIPGLERAGWRQLMPVQAKTIPYIQAGHDMLIQSRTGSGKTGAFLLPVLADLDPNVNACQALILEPTRELAYQVDVEAQTLSEGLGLRPLPVYGGVSYGAQNAGLRQGAHMVLGTPGRILDHLIRGTLRLDKLRYLIFDEADRLLSMGFYPDMQRLQEFLPNQPIHSMMFSSTIPPTVARLAERFLNKPIFINLSSDHIHVTDVEHVYYTVPRMDKDRSLVRILEAENPDSALIFCNTRARTNYVTVVLQRFGYNADELSADLSQSEREEVLGRMRKGQLRFLVATDVAARGIDLPELSHVFIYEPPDNTEDYIHRAGRTGRAGAGGTAISLVDVLEESMLKRIRRQYTIDFQERHLPDDEDLANIVAQRATALLEARLRERDKLKIERMERFLPLIKDLAEDKDTLPLLAMLVDDYYQQAFHNPPEITGTAEERARKKEKRRSSRGDRPKSGGRRGRRPSR
ncbi:MAG TPA: DEAD/DEAH box helicase, partial [Anaerolineales bacterium]|nr:DEAD/DEAH box helicase [Anaerolineales bacterium]